MNTESVAEIRELVERGEQESYDLSETEDLREGAAALLDLLDEAAELLREWVQVDGTEECRLDHHGYCQAHYLEEECRMKHARAFLARFDAEGTDG